MKNISSLKLYDKRLIKKFEMLIKHIHNEKKHGYFSRGTIFVNKLFMKDKTQS
jgi:hypothetical protein